MNLPRSAALLGSRATCKEKRGLGQETALGPLQAEGPGSGDGAGPAAGGPTAAGGAAGASQPALASFPLSEPVRARRAGETLLLNPEAFPSTQLA